MRYPPTLKEPECRSVGLVSPAKKGATELFVTFSGLVVWARIHAGFWPGWKAEPAMCQAKSPATSLLATIGTAPGKSGSWDSLLHSCWRTEAHRHPKSLFGHDLPWHKNCETVPAILATLVVFVRIAGDQNGQVPFASALSHPKPTPPQPLRFLDS